MGLRREDLTPEQLAVQEAYDRSWAGQRRMMADPEVMALVTDGLRRLDLKVSAELTPDQVARQAAYAVTWADQRRMLADPETLVFLKDCFRRLDERPAASPITGTEFMTITSGPVG